MVKYLQCYKLRFPILNIEYLIFQITELLFYTYHYM